MPLENDQPKAASTETKTGIDLLLDLVRVNGKMDLDQIATNLTVSTSIAENWAKLLEQSNLVRITYEVGKMYVAPQVISPEQVNFEVTKVEVKKSTIEHSLTEQLIDLNNLSHMVEELGRSAADADNLYRQKMPDIQQMVSEINRINDEITQSYQQITNIKQKTQTDFESIKKDMEGTIGRLKGLDKDSTTRFISENIDKIGEALRSANDSLITVNNITRDKENELLAAKKSFEEQIKVINNSIANSITTVNVNLKTHKEQVDAITRLLKEREESTKRMLPELKNFDRKRTLTIKKADELMKDFQDKYASIQGAVDKRMDILTVDSDKVRKQIDEIKGSFGEASEVIDTIAYVQKTAATLTEQIASTKAELAKLKERLNALSDAERKLSIEQREKRSGEIELGVSAAAEKIKGIKKSIEGTTARSAAPRDRGKSKPQKPKGGK